MSYVKSLTRRDLLKTSVAAGSLLVIGGGFVAASNAAWALEVTHLKSSTMATLIQMARDIYPHDNIADEFYAAAQNSGKDLQEIGLAPPKFTCVPVAGNKELKLIVPEQQGARFPF